MKRDVSGMNGKGLVLHVMSALSCRVRTASGRSGSGREWGEDVR